MTVSNQTIETTANKSARTFTLRTFINGVLSSKYRTLKMSKEEFNSANYWTQNDWKNFLKTDEYFLIK